MEISLKDRVVVITGGSSGIGKSIAASMKECSAQTIVIDLAIPSDKLERVTYYACDVSNGREVRQTIQQIIEAFGTIDVLVNNAGINKPRLLVDIYGKNSKYVLTEEVYEAFAYTRNVPIEQLDTGYEKAIPLGRLGKLSEIGQLTAFLASDLASYITGTTINISGGKSRG